MKKPRPPSRKPRPAKPAAAAPMPGYDDILAIARLIESGSRFSEFRLRSGDIEVEVRRANGAAAPASAASTLGFAASTPLPIAPAAAPAQPADLPSGSHVVRSPMVGTFFRAPQPGAVPFVQAGGRVAPDTIVCIIEVMKLMNSVSAGIAGVVTHVFVENAQMVEYGQPLVAIRPE